jgi:glyoxylase-like metal-dependent hydrolase (beta-lactamase superfamily II)
MIGASFRRAAPPGGNNMKRFVTFSLGSLSIGFLAASGALAQTPSPPAGQPPPAAPRDFSKVEIKPHPVAGSFYYLEGDGGNVGVLVGDDGVLMIDDQFAPLTEKIMAAVKKLSQKPVRLLINTHVHGDHTGGNENVGKLGINILAHDNVRVRLAQGVNGAAPAPAVALPLITFGDKVALHLDGEDIEIGKFPPAHTDGDSWIRFPKADAIHVGDVFRTAGYPGIDGGNGGTVKGTIEALDMIVKMAGPNTKIVPGHGVVVNRDAVASFRDATIEAQKRVSALIKQGMTLEQVTAANPVADLVPKFVTSGPPPNAMVTERFYQQFYTALKNEL